MAERIRRRGPLPFDEWMEAALYDPDGGFFAAGRGAGRAGGDFVTSVEVGALFGALVARALDEWWENLGRPDPYLVVDAGAGRGQLARTVLRARPRCSRALRYVLVERSAALRAAQSEHLALEPAELVLGPAFPPDSDDDQETVPGTGPVVAALEALPAGPAAGVIIANELADNLPFRIVQRSAAGWDEIRVSLASGRSAEIALPDEPLSAPGDRRFVEIAVPADDALSAAAGRLIARDLLPVGARLPVPTGLSAWLRSAAAVLRRGVIAVIDYGAPAAELAERGCCLGDTPHPGDGWLRTYRAQERAGSALEDPGSRDITADVPVEGLRRAASAAGLTVLLEATQAEWLRSLGVEGMVAAAQLTWHSRGVTDLPAIAARSRVQEADALLDPTGLGAHHVTLLGRRL